MYRLITKGTYEQGLFESASRKYGLDEAILSGGAADDSKDPESDKKAIDNLLKFGASIRRAGALRPNPQP